MSLATQAWPFRGVMLDAARLTEPAEYYQRLIPDLARWGYNTILLHLVDDQGCAVRLDAPRVLPTAGALSIDQWRQVVNQATACGITIIPEIECLGHTGYLTRLPEYAELREPPAAGGLYWSLCPLHPRVMPLMETLFSKVAEIFPAPFIHIGMDEADIGGSPLTREALQRLPVWRLFGEYTLRIHDLVRRLGRSAMMWGDHVLKHAELRDMLPREMTICNWLYGRGHNEDYEKTTRYFLDAQFPVLGCPAGCWSGALLMPHGDNLANIVEFDRTCRELRHPQIRGMINTQWCSFRHLPAIAHPIMAYAAGVFSDAQPDFKSVMVPFVADQFGLSSTVRDAAAQALVNLHEGRKRTLIETNLLAGKRDDQCVSLDEVRAFRDLSAGAGNVLSRVQPEVRRHPDEFNQWVLTAEIMHALADLRLREGPAGAAPAGDNRRQLYRRYREAWMHARNITGTEADEPAFGQVPRYWRDADHALELLEQWIMKNE